MKLAHRRHRTASKAAPGGRGWENPVVGIVAWLSGMLVVGGVVVAFSGPAVAATAEPARDDAAPVRGAADLAGPGAALYLNSCSACHGPNGEGTASGPALTNSGAASVNFYLTTGRMPLGSPEQRPVRQEPAFNPEQIKALVDYVAAFGDGPPIPTVRGGGDVSRGFQLYTANCAACHAATGAGNAVGGGFAAVGLGDATDQQIAEAVIIGPGVMPPFQLTDEEREDLIAYIGFLRSAPSPGGAPIGGTGPVAEGFVAVVIGLTGLVLIARFAGSRRRDHEAAVDAAVDKAEGTS
ncbi:MAG TPA: c-type cytochrome [Candidatus Limnocylindrales bacterium]|nr:c-type cytochrome [Candidatus Limnocylindrales bacterium]